MAPKIQIIFTNADKIFYPGETVTGSVRISTNKAVKCKGFITFMGFSYVHLKGVNSKKSELDENNSKKETYYNWSSQILGREESKETLTAGEHRFDFTHRLPFNIPSSFESKIGHVKHYCEAYLELYKNVSPKSKCTEYLQVNSILDLSAIEYRHALQNPVVRYMDKDIKNMFGKNGKLTAKLKIGREAYIPEEDIVIDAEIKNTSSRLLAMSKAELIQSITYKINNHSLTKEEVIGSNVKKYLPGNTNNFDWTNETLIIPQVPPSQLLGCKIIDLLYLLRFQVFLKGGTKADLEANIALIIGSLPPQRDDKDEKPDISFRSAAFSANAPSVFEPQELFPMQLDYSNVGQQIMPSAPPVTNVSQMYPDISPPSYEECISQLKEVDEE